MRDKGNYHMQLREGFRMISGYVQKPRPRYQDHSFPDALFTTLQPLPSASLVRFHT